MTPLGVIRSIGTDSGNGFIAWNLFKQVPQHRRIPNVAARHARSAHLQRLRINGQVHLAPAPAEIFYSVRSERQLMEQAQ